MWARSVPALILAASLSACVSSGRKVSEDELRGFREGYTTYPEVIERLGRPTRATRHSNGTRTATYTYRRSQVDPRSFIPYVGPFIGGRNTESTSVEFNFDRQGVLTDYAAHEGEETLNPLGG